MANAQNSSVGGIGIVFSSSQSLTIGFKSSMKKVDTIGFKSRINKRESKTFRVLLTG